MNTIVTTSQSAHKYDDNMHIFLKESGLPLVPRNRKSIAALAVENRADAVIVWHSTGPVLYCGGETFYFHPSMAKNRIGGMRKFGTQDPMVTACDLREDDSFLDCTLGLGADSIVASYVCPQGKITGLESIYPVGQVVKWGMRLYHSGIAWLDAPIHRIEVVAADHNAFLSQAPDRSYDVVYFDPMFRHPRLKSQSISPLRHMADHRELQVNTIKDACRVARKRVVVKETLSSGELQRLGCRQILSGNHNPIAYGIIQLD